MSGSIPCWCWSGNNAAPPLVARTREQPGLINYCARSRWPPHRAGAGFRSERRGRSMPPREDWPPAPPRCQPAGGVFAEHQIGGIGQCKGLFVFALDCGLYPCLTRPLSTSTSATSGSSSNAGFSSTRICARLRWACGGGRHATRAVQPVAHGIIRQAARIHQSLRQTVARWLAATMRQRQGKCSSIQSKRPAQGADDRQPLGFTSTG